MATKRKFEPDNEGQQQQSDGPTSDKQIKQNSANSDTSLDQHKVNETNDSNTDDFVSKRESLEAIIQSGSIHIRNSEPDVEDHQQESDSSTSNANKTSDNSKEDVLFGRESDGEQTLSGSIQERNSEPDSEDQNWPSDGSTSNANNTSDYITDDVIFGGESTGEITKSGTIQVGIKETISYKYIDTKGKFITAINELNDKIKDDQTIALDCEGVKLSRFGCVTMVNIGTRDMVYLIDVLKIGDSVFDDGLRSILENNIIEKLMFDCREDADALFHLHKVKLDGVLDVQLLELSNRIYWNGYTILESLENCIENFLSDGSLFRLKKQGREIMVKTPDTWKNRPLDDIMLEYAAVDVLALFKLYKTFESRMANSKLKSASHLYCDNKRSRGRSGRDGNARLPISVRDIMM